ncbi:MAG: hypothetical protein AAF587_29675 [Bacteroidota bacterium]
MKRLQNFAGGRHPANEDWQVLQGQADIFSMMLKGLGPCVISGCEVTPNGSNYDIAAGVIHLNGKIFDFPGATAVNITVSDVLTENPVTTGLYPRPYDDLQTTQDGAFEISLMVDASVTNPSGESLVIRSDGMRTLKEAIRDASKVVGEIIMVKWAFTTSQFDAVTKKGIGDWRGFSLSHGQVGTVDMRRTIPVGAENWDASNPNYFITLGDTATSDPLEFEVRDFNFVAFEGTATDEYYITN